MKKLFTKVSIFISTIAASFVLMAAPAYAQSDPSGEINAIVERVIKIATQVGSGILILFIVKDAFDLMQNKDNPMVRNMLARDIFLLIISAIFLFKPDFILNAIKYIANA